MVLSPYLNLFPLRKLYADSTILDGIYEIEWAGNTDYALDFQNTNASIKRELFHFDQVVIITTDDSGYSKIMPLSTYKDNVVIDASGGNCNSGDLICKYKDGNRDNQRWKIISNEDGSYSFLCKGNESLAINLWKSDLNTGRIQLYDFASGGVPGHWNLINLATVTNSTLTYLDSQDFVYPQETLFIEDPQISRPEVLSKPNDWTIRTEDNKFIEIYYNGGFYKSGNAEFVLLYKNIGYIESRSIDAKIKLSNIVGKRAYDLSGNTKFNLNWGYNNSGSGGGSGISAPNTFYGGLASAFVARYDLTYEFIDSNSGSTIPIKGSYLTICSIDGYEGIQYVTDTEYETLLLKQTFVENPLQGIFYCPTTSTSDLIGSPDFPKWAISVKVNEDIPTFRCFNAKRDSLTPGNWNPPMPMPLTLYAPTDPAKGYTITK